MTFTILTLFPEMFAPVLGSSILGRAAHAGLVSFDVRQLREYSANKHRRVDDYPFGGGAGLVMTVQPITDAIDAVRNVTPCKTIYLSPRGLPFTQALARELSCEPHLLLLCGHYEGVDQRVLDSHIDMEISLGDFVLTGGEIPAMALVDAVARLVPGVLDDGAHEDESFYNGLLEYPQYTRPADYQGRQVPEVLLNGNHAHIQAWRRLQSLKTTWERRPDMLGMAELTEKERVLVAEWVQMRESSNI